MKKFYIILVLCLSITAMVKAEDIPNAGLGIVLQKINNQILVEKIMPKGTNSLGKGDIITEINGITTENLSLEEIQAKLKGAKGSQVSMKILREEEYETFWGKKKTQLVPWEMTLTRNYEFDRNLPVRVFKNGNKYNIKMDYPNGVQNLNCEVVYRKINNQYNRELRCFICKDSACWNRQNLKNTLNLKTEFWVNLDNLTFDKYNKYAPWHNSPASIVKDKYELQLANDWFKYQTADKNDCLKKGGKYSYDIVTGYTSCSYTRDLTKDMTKQEKEDYFRALDFEEEYENYIKYKRMYP